MHMTIAVEKLKSNGVTIKLPIPACDHEMGEF